MAKSGGVVAHESPFCSGRRNDIGAVDGRIAKKGFARERKWVSKMLGNNRAWKVNSLLGFHNGLHPWRCSGWLDAGHPWRWIAGKFGCEESFKGGKSRCTGNANVVKSTRWGRVFDLVDEVLNQHGGFVS